MRSNRLPPIFALAMTAVLVFLVLPNPLRIPQNNPAAQAEFAPTPGENSDPNTANFGETGAATSGGLGSGGAIDDTASDPPPPPVQIFNPRQKRCSGDPPRQTDDPLSPPCVPFFSEDQDNGGATYQGVTATSVRIVLYNDLGLEGDMTAPYSPDQEEAGHESSTNNEQTYLVRTVKALLSFYSNRYQTYNRRVEVIAVPSNGGIATPCGGRKVEAAVINQDWKPFAVVHFGDGGQCFLNEMASYGVPGFGLNSDVPREEFRSYDYEGQQVGMAWGFYPDQETMAQWSAGFICNKLYDRPARFAGTPDLQTTKRVFGLIYPRDSDRGPESLQMASLLLKYLAESPCKLKGSNDGSTGLMVKPFNSNDGKTEAPSIMSSMRLNGVTTIICYCVPVQSELTVSTYQQTAAGQSYYPEWYWDHASRMFRAVWNRQFGNPAMSSFGTSYHWPNPRFAEQHWYRAYRAAEPGTEPNKRFGFDIYHLFLNLFQGLQGAGPELNPESIQRGMFTFKYLGGVDEKATYYTQGDFQRPVGGYGTSHWSGKGGSPYTFIDTGFAWWWDPQGRPPGSSENGCLRAVREGRRYLFNEWPAGDDDLMLRNRGDEKNSPCFEDDTSISKTSQFGF